MSGDILLTFNPGSSTIKLGLFAIEADPTAPHRRRHDRPAEQAPGASRG
jgi:hypothetical protein